MVMKKKMLISVLFLLYITAALYGADHEKNFSCNKYVTSVCCNIINRDIHAKISQSPVLSFDTIIVDSLRYHIPWFY
jgi:hypothetical protein